MTDTRMLVDTCATVRGNGGYCAAHPSRVSMDHGRVYHTRAEAVREYAAGIWRCDAEDVRVRKYGPCRYVARRTVE